MAKGVRPWEVRRGRQSRLRVAPSLIVKLLAGVGCFATATPVLAEKWDLDASVGITETYTNNANYSARGNAEGDFATSLSAGLNVRGVGARASLIGSVAATATIYASETQNNSIAPTVNLLGKLEAIEGFAFVEAQASVSQSFYSPFGPQPGDLVSATANRYTSQTYRLSPYVQGRVPGTNIAYQLRDDNIWTVSSQFGESSPNVPGTYFNGLNGTITSGQKPVGWTLEYNGSYYAASQRDGGDAYGSYSIQVGRAIVSYQITPQLQVSGRGGYEIDRFPLTGSEGAVYGAGAQWNPTQRTQIGGYWEHRFFGSSYQWNMSHRLPRIAMSGNFSKGINTYPQNALTIPAGADVTGFVDAAFTTRIPDPAERALAVQQFLAQSGLPPTLATPTNIFAVNVQLQTAGNVSMVLLGARNSIAFNVFYLESTRISGEGSPLPPALQFAQDNTQAGGGVSYSHRFPGQTTLTASATYTVARSNTDEGAFADARSNNGYLSLSLGTPLGPKTSLSAGVNYSRFVPHGGATTDATSSVNAYVGIRHTF